MLNEALNISSWRVNLLYYIIKMITDVFCSICITGNG